MRKIKFKITNTEGGAAFTVQVIPNAEANRVVGERDDTIKIELTSPPGEASNKPLIKFLADQLNTDPDHIEIVAGHHKNEKVVIILNIFPDKATKRLLG